MVFWLVLASAYHVSRANTGTHTAMSLKPKALRISLFMYSTLPSVSKTCVAARTAGGVARRQSCKYSMHHYINERSSILELVFLTPTDAE